MGKIIIRWESESLIPKQDYSEAIYTLADAKEIFIALTELLWALAGKEIRKTERERRNK
jgi:hypothetical protein